MPTIVLTLTGEIDGENGSGLIDTMELALERGSTLVLDMAG